MMKTKILTLFLLFASLILNTALSTQAQAIENKTARLIDQFGALPNGDLRGRFDVLLAEISNDTGSTAIIFTRGTPAQISMRTRLYKNQIAFRGFESSRIKFVNGRNIGEIRTDFWLVPSGSSEPDFKPEAWIFRELRATTKPTITKAMSDLEKEAQKLAGYQSYIINYGTPAQIANREKWIRDRIPFRRYDLSRITLVNGGPGPVRTVMWLVPPGAENPKP